MVKIRYAGNGVALSSRALIEQVITNTSAKFDNNIVANRFEQTTSTTWEVTIKCVSSRGKGAKRGTTGRRTQSCCWHAWGTFFEELFRLNPEIVIVALGHIITSQSHVGWRDNEPEPMCDCEREPRAEPVVSAPPVRRCDASCRHNSAHHNGVICTRPCGTALLQWEPVVTPTVNHSCATCRYSMDNTISRQSECPPGRCLQEEGLQHWEQLYTPTTPLVSHPTPPGVHRHCNTCRYSSTNTRRGLCTMTRECPEQDGFPRWEQHIPTPIPRCVDCAYSRDRRATVECPRNVNEICLVDNRHRNFVRWVDDPTPSRQRCCRDCKYSHSHSDECCNCNIQCLIGYEHRLFVRFVARTTTVTRECNTCKYSYSHNNDIPCFNVVGACGSGNPKWVQWIPDIDMEGLNPELYMQQPTVMPEERGYMDFEGVV